MDSTYHNYIIWACCGLFKLLGLNGGILNLLKCCKSQPPPSRTDNFQHIGNMFLYILYESKLLKW